MSYKDLIGQKFGRLTVVNIDRIEKEEDYSIYWQCKCDCGGEKVVPGKSLKSKGTQSCGCVRKKLPINCSRCGKQILAIQSRIKANKKSIFCDMICKKDPNARSISWDGYYIIPIEGKGPMREHRHVMEEHINRKLESSEIVHHINGNKLDNRLENLEITDRKEHASLHRSGFRKTHCSKGHEYTKENTYYRPNATVFWRDCRKCIKLRSKFSGALSQNDE